MNECKDCIHFEVCAPYTAPNETYPEVGGCRCFKPKSRFIELPCQVGDYISLQLHLGSTSLCRVNGFAFDNTEKILRVYLDDVINLVNQHYGKNILTKEEAEKALERSNNEKV